MSETTDFQRLVVSMEANFKKWESALSKATNDGERAARKIERDFDKANNGIIASLEGAATRLAGIFAAAFSGRELLATVSHFAKIGDMAERLNVTTDALQALRFIVSQNTGEAEDADAAMQKFSQSLGEAARGEGSLFKLLQANNIALRDKAGNLRSVDEMLVEFARLVAGAGSQSERFAMVVDEMGRRAGPSMLVALLQIAREGLPAVIKASQDVGVVADKELVEKAKEVADAWEKMTTQMRVALFGNVIGAIQAVQEIWDKFSSSVIEFYRMLPGGDRLVRQAQEQGFKRNTFDERWGEMKPPISLPQTTQPTKATGGGGGKDTFERQIDSINKHITAMLADTATVGMNKAAHEQLRVEMALLEAARRAGVEVTDEQIAAFAQLRVSMSAEQALTAAGINLNSQYAATFLKISERARSAAGALEEAKRRFEGVNDSLKFAGNELIDVIDRATQKGANFGEIMQSVMRKLALEMLKAAIIGEGAFAKLFNLSGTGGGVGGIFGLLSGLLSGRAAGGPVSANHPYVVGERGPEVIVPRTAGMVIPNHALPAMRGGGSSLSMPITINAPGADAAALVRVERAVRDLAFTIPRQIDARMHDRNVRGTRG